MESLNQSILLCWNGVVKVQIEIQMRICGLTYRHFPSNLTELELTCKYNWTKASV